MSKNFLNCNTIFYQRACDLFGNMTQQRLADMIGIAQSKISDILGFRTLPCTYEKKQPSAEMVVKIAKAFNVSTDYLLGLTDKGIVKTNRDKLNAMSNDEIKDFFCGALEQIYDGCRVEYDMCDPCPFKKYCRYKHNGFLHWLEMEADDETR